MRPRNELPVTKTSRRQARELALQALYAWQLSGAAVADATEQMTQLEGWDRSDQKLAQSLVCGVMARCGELEQLIAPHLSDRSFAELSPVERAIIYVGTLELATRPETPFKVVINEAVELGKAYGGTDGHRFVNGVLEKLSAQLRPAEFARAKQAV